MALEINKRIMARKESLEVQNATSRVYEEADTKDT